MRRSSWAAGLAAVLWLTAAAPARADVYDDNPAAASRGAGDAYVFARGADGATLERHLAGAGWSDWASIGGVATSGPAASVYGSDIEVFVRGTDGAIFQNTLSGGGWQGWSSLGGGASSAPATAIRRGPGNYLDLAVKGTDNAIWFQTYIPGKGWNGWSSLGGNLTSAPAVVSHANGIVNVFARGPDASLYQRQWNGSAWSDWISLGGVLVGAPTAVSRAENDLDVYVRGGGDATFQRHWDAAGGWAPWYALDNTPVDSSAAAVSDLPGRELLFARSGAGLLAKQWTSGPGWTAWQNLGAVAVPAPPAPPTPAPPPGDGEVGLETGLRCTPPGGKLRVHITIRKAKGKARPRVQRIVFYTKGKGRRVRVDRKAPFVVRMTLNRPAGSSGRVYARVYYKRSKHGPTHRKTVSRRFVMCR